MAAVCCVADLIEVASTLVYGGPASRVIVARGSGMIGWGHFFMVRAGIRTKRARNGMKSSALNKNRP